MAAPTPVSAYLHSATMVKAGVYLVARMTPVLGATPLWTTTVTVVGAVTMVVGAYRCVQETDLKRILAYSTLSALGVLMMLLGVGTPQAVVAALVYLVAHACYKGALFLVAGAIDHETGTRDITTLQGLRQAMPLTALAGGAAALSMAGVPLTLGFIGKDGAYEALMQGGSWDTWLLTLLVVSSILLGLAGFLAGVVPFRGTRPDPEAVHEPGWALWLPPLTLAACGVVVGLIPSILNAPLSAAAAAILNGSLQCVAGDLARSLAGIDAERPDPGGCRSQLPGAECDTEPYVASAARRRDSVHVGARGSELDQRIDRAAASQCIPAVIRHGDRADVRRRGRNSARDQPHGWNAPARADTCDLTNSCS